MNDNLDMSRLDLFDAAYFALQELNERVQKAARESGRLPLPAKAQDLRDFCTVRLCAGARSGKTTWIAYAAGPNDIILHSGNSDTDDAGLIRSILENVKPNPYDWPDRMPLKGCWLLPNLPDRVLLETTPRASASGVYRRIFVEDASFIQPAALERMYVWACKKNPGYSAVTQIVLVG